MYLHISLSAFPVFVLFRSIVNPSVWTHYSQNLFGVRCQLLPSAAAATAAPTRTVAAQTNIMLAMGILTSMGIPKRVHRCCAAVFFMLNSLISSRLRRSAKAYFFFFRSFFAAPSLLIHSVFGFLFY